MRLIRYNNSNPLNAFEHPFLGLSLGKISEGGFLAVDVSEDENNIVVKADLPGLKKEELQVSLENDVLTIRGERKSENEKKEKNYHRVERSYGVFERQIVLGSNIDESKVSASYKDGVLELTLPKSETSRTKRIEIKE